MGIKYKNINFKIKDYTNINVEIKSRHNLRNYLIKHKNKKLNELQNVLVNHPHYHKYMDNILERHQKLKLKRN